jgi:glucan biosynthesis protein C
MPVYVVHHVPVLLLGLAMLPTDLPVWLEMMVIWIAAGAISLAVYHWLIRPWRLARWAMGMARSAQPMRWPPQWTVTSPGAPALGATPQSPATLSGWATSSGS